MKALITYGFAAFVLGIVAILIVPLPPPLLDVLLGINIFVSACVLIISMTVTEPLQFSAFAPSLLVATLFRLALDVSATRLILTHGHEPGGVGSLIPAFGAFVVGGNLVVGLIVFVILVTIQFIVVASGSQRVAEVAARFTLDAMPGKQMAIDADVHAGLIDMESARRKREAVQNEADFYGAMDGAGKFVKGDAIAALIIVGINLAGGIVVGIAYHGLAPLEAISTYALLSVGNALITTLPALLMSTAMGMMVTRVAADGSLGSDLAQQVLQRPDVLRIAGGLMLVLAFVPGLPMPVFMSIGSAAIGMSFVLTHRARDAAAHLEAARKLERERAMRAPETALGLVGVDPLSISLGPELLSLLGIPNADRMLGRIAEIRRVLAAEIGIVIPGVRLRDDVTRAAHSYAIAIRDGVVAEGTIVLDRLLAVASEDLLQSFPGEPTREPVYDLPARWIAPDQRALALAAGALVFDPISIVGSHLAEVARAHAADLFGRQELQTLLEYLRGSVPALIKDVTEALPIVALHRVFTLLLRERVWPRDVVATLEAILEAAQMTREPRELHETVRRAIVPAQLRRQQRHVLEPLMFAPDLERRLAAAWLDGALTPEPSLAVFVRGEVERYLAATPPARSAIVCGGALRPALSECLAKMGLSIDVYAFGELPRSTSLCGPSVLEDPEQSPQSPVMVSA